MCKSVRLYTNFTNLFIKFTRFTLAAVIFELSENVDVCSQQHFIVPNKHLIDLYWQMYITNKIQTDKSGQHPLKDYKECDKNAHTY